jgi:hypothetical protein
LTIPIRRLFNPAIFQLQFSAPATTRGAIVPSTVKTEPVPSKAATGVPALKSFNFAMVDGKLLIVNPSDKKIVDVISG